MVFLLYFIPFLALNDFEDFKACKSLKKYIFSLSTKSIQTSVF